MTDQEIQERARRALKSGSAKPEIEPGDRVIRLDDPDATGYAVEAWIYLMDDPQR